MGKIDTLLLVVGPALGIWLAAVLLRRRLFAEFPFFFTYIAALIVGDTIKLAVVQNRVAYFYLFWAFEILYVLLVLLALHEVFFRVFRAFFQVYRWFWLLFPAAAGLAGTIAVVYALRHPPAQANRVIAFILSCEVAIHVMQAGIFLLFLGVQWLFKVRRRNYPWGIVEGFAVVALGGVAFALRSEFGTRFALLVRYGPPVAYILAEILWLATFLRPPDAEPQWTQAITPAQAWEEIQQTTRVLKSILAGRKRR